MEGDPRGDSNLSFELTEIVVALSWGRFTRETRDRARKFASRDMAIWRGFRAEDLQWFRSRLKVDKFVVFDKVNKQDK